MNGFWGFFFVFEDVVFWFGINLAWTGSTAIAMTGIMSPPPPPPPPPPPRPPPAGALEWKGLRSRSLRTVEASPGQTTPSACQRLLTGRGLNSSGEAISEIRPDAFSSIFRIASGQGFSSDG